MVHMVPSNIRNIEYVCSLEVLGVQLIYPAMFEHDVQTSRHWATDGELAAVVSVHNTYIEHLELLSCNTSYIMDIWWKYMQPLLHLLFPWFANTIPTYLI